MTGRKQFFTGNVAVLSGEAYTLSPTYIQCTQRAALLHSTTGLTRTVVTGRLSEAKVGDVKVLSWPAPPTLLSQPLTPKQCALLEACHVHFAFVSKTNQLESKIHMHAFMHATLPACPASLSACPPWRPIWPHLHRRLLPPPPPCRAFLPPAQASAACHLNVAGRPKPSQGRWHRSTARGRCRPRMSCSPAQGGS